MQQSTRHGKALPGRHKANNYELHVVGAATKPFRDHISEVNGVKGMFAARVFSLIFAKSPLLKRIKTRGAANGSLSAGRHVCAPDENKDPCEEC